MDSAPVNWEALDALVIDFAKSERLIDDSPPPPLPPPVSSQSSSYRWRLLICQIRRSIESGDIDSAIHLLQAHAPAVLDDHRLLFRLQKQARAQLLSVLVFGCSTFVWFRFSFLELEIHWAVKERNCWWSWFCDPVCEEISCALCIGCLPGTLDHFLFFVRV